MQNIITVYKPIGFTPLEIIRRLRKQRPELAGVKIGYAGRLDPMAHGALLLMIGEETKKREIYLSLPKTYEFEAVFGIQTDTYDLLGYLKEVELKKSKINVNLFVNTFVNKHLGRQLQFYPPYSSKPVKGKPLFWWAKNDKLNEITIPKHEIEIFDLRCTSLGILTFNTLKQKVEDSIALVNGDFRQKEILERWKQLFASQKSKNETLQTAKFYINCSSGTYIRELINQLGKEICCGAIALDILRRELGEYTLKDSIHVI